MAATDLRRIFEGDLAPAESVMYESFYLMHQGSGRYHVQLDGHAGSVDDFDVSDYAGPLELVDRLNDLSWDLYEIEHFEDDEALVEWAGKIMTEDEQKAEDNPEKYVHVPPADEIYDDLEYDSAREELEALNDQ